MEALRRAFTLARGVTVEVPPDIRIAMWSKFLFIAALGGVGALTRSPIGACEANRSRASSCGGRSRSRASPADIVLSPDIVDRTLAYIDTLPVDGTASMQRDIWKGGPRSWRRRWARSSAWVTGWESPCRCTG